MRLAAFRAAFCNATLIFFSFVGVCYPQSMESAESNVSCIVKLEIPRYPALAQQARIAAKWSVSVILDSSASVRSVSPTTAPETKAPRVFVEEINRSMRASVFAPNCAGKTIALMFDFVLKDGGSQYPTQSFAFGYPNHFYIGVLPMFLNPESTQPQ
jgi:hypothetical protein